MAGSCLPSSKALGIVTARPWKCRRELPCMPPMWLHKSWWSAPLRSLRKMCIQNGPPLSLDKQLCWILHNKAILAVFVLRDMLDLRHSALDVHGCVGLGYSTYFSPQFLDFKQLEAHPHLEICYKRGEKESYLREQRVIRKDVGTWGRPQRYFLILSVQRCYESCFLRQI